MPNPDYRKMFKNLKPFYPNPDDLNKLATVMSGLSKFPDTKRFVEHLGSFHKETRKPIPAGYTYLAQFITHDISFDERSDRHIREDLPFDDIAVPEFIKNLKNLRKPNFDLETVYGYNNPTNRGEIPRHELIQDYDNPFRPPFLKLGNTEGNALDGGTAALPYPHDLPRGNASVQARIVEPRNDENLLLAQILVMFIKFHNAMVAKLSKSATYKDEAGKYKKEELFENARKLTIRYYQTIILTDLLPRIVSESLIDDIVHKLGSGNLFYRPDMFIPLEFSVAAFRFGHSMIRQKYNLNIRHFDEKQPSASNSGQASLDQLMMFTGRGEMDFLSSPDARCPRLKLPSIWIVNWNWFYEIDDSVFTNEECIKNIAEPIDTNLPIALLRLRPDVRDPKGQASSLAALDLFRGRRLGLPTGQDVAREIGVEPLNCQEIVNLIMFKRIQDVGDAEERKIKERLCDAFSRKTPLWFYILAESEIQNDGKLGAVGSRIVAETIIQLLYYSEYSILQQKWKDGEDFLLKNDKFGMPEMLKFVQRMGKEHFETLYPDFTQEFDELNPLGDG